MVYTVSYNVKEGLKMSKKMLLPVGVVVLIIGVIILLLNPDPAQRIWKLQEMLLMHERQLKQFLLTIKLMLGCILSACSVVALACP